MIADMTQFEQRLSSLETALGQIQQRLGMTPSKGSWVDQVSGSLADIPEEDYQRFLDCCREVRSGAPGSTGVEAQP